MAWTDFPASYNVTKAPCGNIAYFDVDSGIGYRCEQCCAIIGSIGMPRQCKELMDMEKVVEILRNKKMNVSSKTWFFIYCIAIIVNIPGLVSASILAIAAILFCSYGAWDSWKKWKQR